MKEKVVIVPRDHVAIVNGLCICTEAINNSVLGAQTQDIHAIQWENGVGHVEFADASIPNNKISGDEDYTLWVAPFVALWEAGRSQIEEEQANAEAKALIQYNSIEARAERVRTERDRRIASCDWLIIRHSDQCRTGVTPTLSEEKSNEWDAYREALRDLPAQAGFPWDGGAELTPWPTEPSDA